MGQFNLDFVPGKMPLLGSQNFFLELVLESGKKVMKNRKLKPSSVKTELETIYECILSLK